MVNDYVEVRSNCYSRFTWMRGIYEYEIELGDSDVLRFMSDNKTVYINGVKKVLPHGCFIFDKRYACNGCYYFHDDVVLRCAVNPKSCEENLICSEYTPHKLSQPSRVIIMDCIVTVKPRKRSYQEATQQIEHQNCLFYSSCLKYE